MSSSEELMGLGFYGEGGWRCQNLYRILRKDDSGTDWFLSGIAPKGIRKIKVTSGRSQKIAIDPSITFGARGNAKSGFMIQVRIQGQHHAGITIYRSGKRIPMHQRLHHPSI